MRIWRISNYADLSGKGGEIIEGRWHSLGQPIVYCTDHPSTALLEILVQVTRATVPDFFQLIEIDVPEGIETIEPLLPDGWEGDLRLTRLRGTQFLLARRHALMKVPSSVMPKANNYLLNPKHPDASRISIIGAYSYPFDSRLLK